jgi:heparanase
MTTKVFFKRALFLLLTVTGINAGAQNSQSVATNNIDVKNVKFLGRVDDRFQSFNIEMCEVIGGDFWIPYNLVDSVRKHSNKKGFEALKWGIEPINLYEKKLRTLASALGPTYVRVSGTWANDVYFQNNDEAKLKTPPAGFNNILTRQQWKGVVDFCKAVDGKLVTSFPISDGMRDEKGNWRPDQVKSIIDYTKSVGGNIAAAEFFNEPSHAAHGNAPKGYDGARFRKEFGVFKDFMTSYAPDIKIIGPGSTGEGGIIPSISIPVEDIMASPQKPAFEVFTYHYYGNVSKRCFGGQTLENALSQEWLSKTEKGLQFYEGIRDQYLPNTPIWLTETAETACGGNPWAATYADCFRYLEQLGRLAKKNVQVVMHNTLARSEYAILDHDTHNPRPNYWAALLWNRLMGNQVYEGAALEPGVDVFVHNLKGSKNGKTVLVINTNDKPSFVNIPSAATRYVLTADELATKTVKLNGKVLTLTKTDEIPAITGMKSKAGRVALPAQSIAFFTFNK